MNTPLSHAAPPTWPLTVCGCTCMPMLIIHKSHDKIYKSFYVLSLMKWLTEPLTWPTATLTYFLLLRTLLCG